jgi:hypothetical protein
VVAILTRGPHKLLKNLGALSEYAKMQPKFDQNKRKLKSLLSILDTMEWSYATVPLSSSHPENSRQGWEKTQRISLNSFAFFLKGRCCIFIFFIISERTKQKSELFSFSAFGLC